MYYITKIVYLCSIILFYYYVSGLMKYMELLKFMMELDTSGIWFLVLSYDL